MKLSTLIARLFAISRHVYGILLTFPSLGPATTATIFVDTRSVYTALARLSTKYIHVFRIVLTFALGFPQLALILDTSIGARQKVCTVGILVLATAISAGILAIQTHIRFVLRTLAVEGPFGTLFVFIRAFGFGRAFSITAEAT